jgi:hypothetical protein
METFRDECEIYDFFLYFLCVKSGRIFEKNIIGESSIVSHVFFSSLRCGFVTRKFRDLQILHGLRDKFPAGSIF